MTLQEAIEEVIKSQVSNGDWSAGKFDYGFEPDVAQAIAAILNAVVKGELK